MNLLLYGAPGSGKGTQANMLRSRFGIPHIATGDMLRAEIQSGTPLGRQAQPILAAGQYVPDDIMIGMIRNRVRQPDSERHLDRVLYLKVEMAELLERLSGRLVCPTCQRTYPPGADACAVDGTPLVQREDDKAEAVRPRIEIYLSKTVPVLEHYRGAGIVSEIDGRGTIDQITGRVLNAIGENGRFGFH